MVLNDKSDLTPSRSRYRVPKFKRVKLQKSFVLQLILKVNPESNPKMMGRWDGGLRFFCFSVFNGVRSCVVPTVFGASCVRKTNFTLTIKCYLIQQCPIRRS